MTDSLAGQMQLSACSFHNANWRGGYSGGGDSRSVVLWGEWIMARVVEGGYLRISYLPSTTGDMYM